MTEAEKYSTLIEKIPQVHEEGKNSMLKYHPEATVSGSYISLDDVSEMPHEVKCKISGVDDPTSVAVTKYRKNILKKTLTSRIQNGVTYTVNDDGSITANGTAERTTYNTLGAISLAEGVTYRLSGCPSGGGSKSYMLYAQNKTSYTDYYDSGSGKSFNSKGGKHDVLMVVYSGAVLENVTFYPMLVVGEVSGEYEPYMAETYTPKADGTVEGMTRVSPYMNIFTDTEGTNIEVTYRKSKGLEVEKEQFYNRFRQGIINDSISFEWMTGLGRTNTALIVGGLSDNATGQTLTLNLAGVNKAYETSSGANDGSTSAAFAELVATKPNWTITLI